MTLRKLFNRVHTQEQLVEYLNTVLNFPAMEINLHNNKLIVENKTVQMSFSGNQPLLPNKWLGSGDKLSCVHSNCDVLVQPIAIRVPDYSGGTTVELQKEDKSCTPGPRGSRELIGHALHLFECFFLHGRQDRSGEQHHDMTHSGLNSADFINIPCTRR